MATDPRAQDRASHAPNCAREVMRHADDSAAYLSEKCTCGAALAAPSTPPVQKALILLGEVLGGYQDGVVGDVDGGWLQDRAYELGLLVLRGDEGNYFLADDLASLLASVKGQK